MLGKCHGTSINAKEMLGVLGNVEKKKKNIDFFFSCHGGCFKNVIGQQQCCVNVK
jgi:hypothetical protein